MRRNWRQTETRRVFRGAELLKLLSGVLMLVLFGVMIARTRDAEMWRWLAPGEEATAKSATTAKAGGEFAAKTSVDVEPTGPTDEEPEELAKSQDEFQAITDGTCKIQREEMVPYDRLVAWVQSQTFARLERRAQKGLRYTDLYDDVDQRRGALVALNVEVRMAADAGVNQNGVPLTEAWAVTEESRGRLYSLIVVDYPKGMPVGFNICAKGKFAGYLLKLQGYEPAIAKPGQKPEKAPLLIGRLEWIRPIEAKSPVDQRQEWIWGLGALGLAGLVLLVRYVHSRWVRPSSSVTRRGIANLGNREPAQIEAWLDEGAFGAGPPDEEEKGSQSKESGRGTTDEHR